MKKHIHYLFYLLLLSLPFTTKANDSLQIAQIYNSKEHQSFLDLVLDVKDETTWEQWELFCEIMSLTNDSEFRAYAKTADPKKYTVSKPTEVIKLTEDDALQYAQWLTKHGKDKNYLQQVLQGIANCPVPTVDSVVDLCLALMKPEPNTSEESIGNNYQNVLWKLACATPKTNPTAVGRVKVKRYWNKHKKEMRCPGTGTRHTDNLSVAKHAIDTSAIRFTRELAIAYKVDFNFVDKKDGLTILDFVQKRIRQANQLIPKPEQTLIEYQAIYDAIVKAGGKHKKDLKSEEY